jgi:hypothetical protein
MLRYVYSRVQFGILTTSVPRIIACNQFFLRIFPEFLFYLRTYFLVFLSVPDVAPASKLIDNQ